MSFLVLERRLTRKCEPEYRAIFKKCFPRDTWKSSIPFPKDPVITALDKNGRVVGFCLVHNETPYAMKQGPGSFMYNLCVDPVYQRQGAATAILQYVTSVFGKCYAHSLVDGPHELMTRNGWKRVGLWREKYIEYSWGFDVEDEIPIPETLNTDHYDPDENLIYLS